MVCRALRLLRRGSSCQLLPCGNGDLALSEPSSLQGKLSVQICKRKFWTLDPDFHGLFYFILDIISTSQTATTRGIILSDIWPHESIIQISLRVAKGKGLAHYSMILYIFIYIVNIKPICIYNKTKSFKNNLPQAMNEHNHLTK